MKNEEVGRNRMNERTLRVLEYPKIKEMLIQKTESSLGRTLAQQIEPSTDYHQIVSAQQETSEAANMILQRGNVPLGGIHDLSYHLKRAEIGSYLYPKQLLEAGDTLRAARKLKGFLKDSKEGESRFPHLEGYINSLFVFKEIEERINECIIGEDEISDHASPTLRSIRRSIEAKHQGIRSRLNSIISSVENQKYLQEAIITIRQDRYVVPVKQEYRMHIPGLIHDQSSSGATLFIEPMAIVQLNNELKELKLKEKAEIEKILRELTGLLEQRADEIRSNQSILAKLDFIFAKGKLAVQMNAVEPQLNQKGWIRIKNGKHPLLNEKTVVPTNIWIGDTFRTLVITGPNTGGKTVTLKTVGLFALMTQSGLHIPADYGTQMSVFDQIFADIGDEQSIEQSLSTFSSHMTNIVEILNGITENSLVLLDELGAGTDPTEGAALAIAILEYLHSMGVRTVATTHYTELKKYALTREGVENASVEFDIETLSPTYRLLIGVPGKSNAFEISRRLGLDQQIVDKAKDFISKEDIAFEDILATIQEQKRVAEAERDEAIKLRLIIEEQKKKYEKQNEALALQRDKILQDAREEARKIFKSAKEESEKIIKELRNLAKEQDEKARNRQIEEARRALSSKLDDVAGTLAANIHLGVNSAPPKDLKVGDTVNLLNLNQVGHVLSPPDKNGDVTVQVGILKMNVNMKHLRLIEDGEDPVKQAGTGKIFQTKAQNVKSSIDLRGQNLEEAEMNTDKYLDDAYLAGLKEVTIIHGKGTGVLREGIQQFLKSHKHVQSFRAGSYGEGGTGVTIVLLK